MYLLPTKDISAKKSFLDLDLGPISVMKKIVTEKETNTKKKIQNEIKSNNPISSWQACQKCHNKNRNRKKFIHFLQTHFMSFKLRSTEDEANLIGSIVEDKFTTRAESCPFAFFSHPTTSGISKGSKVNLNQK